MTDKDRLVADRYRLCERIGAGAGGVVWRAVDERLGRAVALRQLVVAPHVIDARERVLREARVAARLQHPNVVLVFDVVDDDLDAEGGPWLVLEYVPSRSLATALRTGPLPVDHVTRTGAQAAAGLAAAHALDVLHRDVRPGSVLLGEDGIVKIADFAIPPVRPGTPGYLAPELVTGEPYAPAADVFALGATLYAAVAGEPPASAGEPAPLSRATGPLAALLAELLRPEPADRPTMSEAHAMLATLASTSGPPMTDPMRAWTTPVQGGEVPPVDPGPPTVGVRLPVIRWRLVRLAVAMSGYRAWPVVRSALPIRCR